MYGISFLSRLKHMYIKQQQEATNVPLLRLCLGARVTPTNNSCWISGHITTDGHSPGPTLMSFKEP